ncbi:MAG: hypothetical protein IJE17_05560 [Clostridia bacterium]|nr:hypothetical protein [Clostridia bacterium]
MYRYSIMPVKTLTDHLEEAAQDIRDQYEKRIADCALVCMTLTPEADPPIGKAAIYCERYGRLRDRLAEMNLSCGVLVQASIGHGYVLDQPNHFQQCVNLNDGKEVHVVCPYDENFRNHMRNEFAVIAAHRPAMIMVDDDFRLMARPGMGCACPRHMEEFNRRAGTNMTREELYRHTQGTSEEDRRYTEIFIETQRDSLLGAAKAYREGIDRVDPSLPGSFCACGNATEFASEIAKILAGKGNPVIVRLNNGSYTAAGPRWFSNIARRAAAQAAILSDKVDAMLAETDTCPQNRYSTSAQMVHAHFTATILEGASGAKHWITRLNTFEPNSGVAYRKKLAKYAGFYETLCQITPALQWLGCRMPVPARPAYGFAVCPDPKESDGWSACVMERMGIPMYFSKNPGGAVFMDGPADDGMSDAEILELFKGPLFLASDTAKRLIDRGFGKYIGVDVKPWNGPHTSGERLKVNGNVTNAQMKIQQLIPLREDVRIESTVFHLRDGKYEDPLFPGVTVFKNELGGMTVVFAGTPKTKFNHQEAFAFLTESRKKQLAALIRESGHLPVYYPEDAEVYFRAAKCPDGKMLCVLFNLGLDVLEEIPLICEKTVRKVERLMPDGNFAPCVCHMERNALIVETDAQILEPVVLLME